MINSYTADSICHCINCWPFLVKKVSGGTKCSLSYDLSGKVAVITGGNTSIAKR